MNSYFITLILLLTWLIVRESGKYITIDGIELLVKRRKDSHKAGMLIKTLRDNVIDLVDNLVKEKHNLTPHIKRLHSKIRKVSFNETIHDTGSTTSYSINKGEALHLCVRKKNTKRSLHDENTLMYVTIHEIAHIASPEIGHTPLFYEIMDYILDYGVNNGYINLEDKDINYCGMSIRV